MVEVVELVVVELVVVELAVVVVAELGGVDAVVVELAEATLGTTAGELLPDGAPGTSLECELVSPACALTGESAALPQRK